MYQMSSRLRPSPSPALLHPGVCLWINHASVAYFLSIILIHIISKLVLVVILIFQPFLFNSMEGTFVLRFLFGLPPDLNDGDDCPEEYLKDVQQLLPILDLRMTEDDSEPFSNTKITIHQV